MSRTSHTASTLSTRRGFLKQMSLAAAGSAIAGSAGMIGTLFADHEQRARDRKPPNVLFIPVDDLRIQLGCYGHTQTLSPNIDRLAKEGVLFERAYCQVPVCGASRASLMTGIRPHFEAGRFTRFDSRADNDTPEAVSLAKHFKRNGYYTISNGKVFHNPQDMSDSWHEIALPGPTGWNLSRTPAGSPEQDLWLDPQSNKYIHPESKRGPFLESADVPDEAYHDGRVAAKTIADLKRLKDTNQPFFLACGFFMPHLPWNVPKRYYDLYDPEAIDLAEVREPPRNLPPEVRNSGEIRNYTRVDEFGWPDSDKFHRQARHAYYASVSYIDTLIGRILDTLKTLEMDRDTIVILWGDHGWHLGEYNFWGKHNTLNNALQVPLIVRAPDRPAGVRTDALVEFVDIYPTLCELAGLPLPKSHRLAGRSFVPLMESPNRPWKEAAYSEWLRGSTVKTDRYIYTEWPSGNRMLFDHHKDPYETVNIADRAEHAEIVVQLRKLLRSLDRDYEIARSSMSWAFF